MQQACARISTSTQISWFVGPPPPAPSAGGARAAPSLALARREEPTHMGRLAHPTCRLLCPTRAARVAMWWLAEEFAVPTVFARALLCLFAGAGHRSHLSLPPPLPPLPAAQVRRGRCCAAVWFGVFCRGWLFLLVGVNGARFFLEGCSSAGCSSLSAVLCWRPVAAEGAAAVEGWTWAARRLFAGRARAPAGGLRRPCNNACHCCCKAHRRGAFPGQWRPPGDVAARSTYGMTTIHPRLPSRSRLLHICTPRDCCQTPVQLFTSPVFSALTLTSPLSRLIYTRTACRQTTFSTGLAIRAPTRTPKQTAPAPAALAVCSGGFGCCCCCPCCCQTCTAQLNAPLSQQASPSCGARRSIVAATAAILRASFPATWINAFVFHFKPPHISLGCPLPPPLPHPSPTPGLCRNHTGLDR